MLMRQADDRQRRMLVTGNMRGQRQADITKTILAMHMGRILGRMHQRLCRTGKHRHIGTAGHFAQLQRIAHGVFQAHIAGRHGQTDHIMPGIGKGHQQGQGIINTRIGVDQQRNLFSHDAFALVGIGVCHRRDSNAKTAITPRRSAQPSQSSG